ncbi:MobC family plasmid mobilization relaxosome protein [Streptomyces scopuliridis]|uniref:MobC family plasmid mobilization relaxosome protein n=1 Tax=Streptomyces scopuliridis TaxID=452529 RepID=A0ACD4ZT52_9ACTN|nr:plasmid mobilization relaxosome protein MobC [Streptomyces scopuliridis]WSC01625.1 MobC family plasmid mobilization relaxosome protein [Streptomyces scopuliridis]WSC04836.1 MobC family plasmid mobilization relaxosome protein [Streptomyces scopuliridis]
MGKAAWPSPAPGVAGAVQHRGALDRQAATEGGSQPGGEEQPRSRASAAPASTARKRSPQKNKRARVCNIRLNDDEWSRLTTAARTSRKSLPAYLVRAGLAAADDSENTAAVIAGHRDLIAELFAARRHLGQVGNNLNQVVRAINSGGRPAELDAVVSAVQRAVARVQAVTDRMLEQD